MLGGIKYIKMWTDPCEREARNMQQKHHEYLKVKPRQTTATFQCHVGTHHPRNLYPDPGRQDLVTGFFFRGVCAPGTSLVESFGSVLNRPTCHCDPFPCHFHPQPLLSVLYHQLFHPYQIHFRLCRPYICFSILDQIQDCGEQHAMDIF
jgi:hypothetical protein